ncbi:hypothetical protein [Williamsoniiplasma lucivorax]|uniref:Uncharacterized protein n=1 Tax=Williamsoniiplasma lucivorax TaxID=209274 RepID=A0A2S5RCW9_9MOLU|nr:hypothetical protein [Williamsoniiplasma lucivorax]PPE05181.1 hypothetical protein ELUCI_v1c07170 [Williamsoniiplasma lucivorax]
MIEFLKLPEINKKDIENLKLIAPWWSKIMNKQIKSLQKTMVKFSVTPTDFWKQEKFTIDEYHELFRAINNYLNFYNQKIGHLLTSKKAFRRFEKWVATYANTLGLGAGIAFMLKYFHEISVQEVGVKQDFAIKLAQEKPAQVYDRYKKEIKKILHHDQELAQIYKFETLTSKTIFPDYQLVFKTIAKFATNLNMQKKIDDHLFVKVLYYTILTANYMHAYIYFSTNFIKRII